MNHNNNDDDDDTAALLAELRAISNQSKSSSRFGDTANDHDHDDDNNTNSTTLQNTKFTSSTVHANLSTLDHHQNENDDVAIPSNIVITTTMPTTTTAATTTSTTSTTTTMPTSPTVVSMLLSRPTTTGVDGGLLPRDQPAVSDPNRTTTTTTNNNITTTTGSSCSSSPYHRAETPPLSTSPSKKNSVHVASILHRHSPQVLKRMNSSSPTMTQQQQLLLVPIMSNSSTSNDDDLQQPSQLPQQQRSVVLASSAVKMTTTTRTSLHHSGSILSAPSDEIVVMESSSFSPKKGSMQCHTDDTDDTELLALLLSSSPPPPSTSNNNNTAETTSVSNSNVIVDESTTSIEVPSLPPPTTAKPDAVSLPPWKRRNSSSSSRYLRIVGGSGGADPLKNNTTDDVNSGDGVATTSSDSNTSKQQQAKEEQGATPSATTMSAFEQPKSNHIKSTFRGERGGVAEDAELLALLRNISSKSSASIYDDTDITEKNQPTSTTMPVTDNITTSNDTVVVPNMTTTRTTKSRTTDNVVPPWKKKRSAATTTSITKSSVSTSDTLQSLNENEIVIVTKEKGPANENNPKTESLMEGNQPSSTLEQQQEQRQPTPSSSDNSASSNGRSGGGIRSDIVSKPFQGDRGGIAEDEELLALLRNVSSASSRFNDYDATQNDAAAMNNPTDSTTSSKPNSAHNAPSNPRPSTTKTAIVPPWKKKGSTKPTTTQKSNNATAIASTNTTNDIGNVDNNPPISVHSSSVDPVPSTSPSSGGGGIKSDIISKPFQGERGGVAEDEELLALLRGVSANSSNNRFSDDDNKNQNIDYNNTNMAIADHVSLPSSVSTPNASQPVSQPPPVATQMESPDVIALTNTGQADVKAEEVLPIESLPSALTDKNWKVRCQAYDTLSFILRDHVQKSLVGNDSIDSDLVLQGLDDRIHTFMEDTNAGALDKAIEFCLLFAEHCTGAGNSDVARRIASSMIQKNCFSSRPTTLKMSNSMILKLMEVSEDGNSSIHSIVDVLLTEGLASKKPKVITAAASLLLDATYHFGATSMPLASFTNSAPKMLAHSNATVRECCIKVLAEICRALGSKSPIQDVVDKMKKAQQAELDAQLSDQPEPTPVRTGLRRSRQMQQQGVRSDSSAADAIAVLQANAKDLEAQRYAARNAVDVVAAIAKTDYAEQIALSKWSEKVAALDKLLECGGEKPYKLMQPSSSVNYGPLISEMKKLLAHTHFVVCSRAIQVLAMLAEGVGDKLFPHIRPTLTPLLQLSKDKKLTTEVSNGLDALFGNVLSFESLMDNDDAIPSMVNEKIQKNALARATALTFLQRCVIRQSSAGSKGKLSTSIAAAIASLCCSKLDDSDATVRKAAMGVLESLLQQSTEADKSVVSSVEKVIDQLRTSNPRAHKTLKMLNLSGETKENTSANIDVPITLSKTVEKPSSQPTSRVRSAAPSKRPPSPAPKTESGPKQSVGFTSGDGKFSLAEDRHGMPHFEEAMIHVTSLSIPQWDASEDDGGILAGLKATKWQLRHDAIELLRSFVESGGIDKSSSDIKQSVSCILLILQELTRGFKETNVNIMKAILNLCIAFCEYNESKEILLPTWVIKNMASACVQKISDRKLLLPCQKLLTSIIVVSIPHSVVQVAFMELKSSKSPVAHEEYLKWFQSFLDDFGAFSLGRNVSDVIPHILEELGSLNAKVKREALSCLGTLHRHLGPGLKSLALSMEKNSSLKEQMQKCFDNNSYDPSLATTEWPRSSIMGKNVNRDGSGETNTPSLGLEIPKLDLLSSLPADIVSKLGSKDSKTSWKIRKEALDEIESALKSCSGLLETAPSQMKQLIELARGLRDRLTDLQINLRPTAARIIGLMISLVDKASQAKLCKVVLVGLINEAMNDIKKPMRDASLLAIRSSITLSEFDGGGTNVLTIEPLLNAIVSEVNEAAVRSGGLPEVLLVLLSVIDALPPTDCEIVTRRYPAGDKFAAVLIDCLTSSKSDTRSTALSLLNSSMESGIITLENIKLATDRLKPALQRAVGPMIAKLAKKDQSTKPKEEKDAPKLGAENAMEKQKVIDIRLHSNRADQSGLSKTIARRISGESSPSKSSSIFPGHPLLLDSVKHPSGAPRSIIWTEYPDEPHGSVLENLKRSWSTILPLNTVSALFPVSGIRKQDDAKQGLEVLSHALSIDRSNDGKVIIEQADFILKWFMFVLCSKESTTGLVEILTFGKNLFTFLSESKRELSDNEALDTVPLLFDKASCAKGRFRDTFLEINSLLENEDLLTSRRMVLACISVIDSSPHVKAKAQACQICLSYIDKTGLAGFGKKGVLATAKMLSQETTMHRLAALDLMESILIKMNGDLLRLARICGQSLNEKGRQLIEERWHKNHSKEALHSAAPGNVANGPGSPQKGNVKDADQKDIFDELPRLLLRTSNFSSRPSPRKVISDGPSTASESFAFTFSSGLASPRNTDSDLTTIPTDTNFRSLNALNIEPSGAAAALRARLLKIREKSKIPEGTMVNTEPEQRKDPGNDFSTAIDFDYVVASVETVLRKTAPIAETDPFMETCLNSLKTVHSALSTPHTSDDTNRSNLENLRGRLLENVNQIVGLLRSLIGFSIDSGKEETNAGMILPLLSLSLATLMALFRDNEFALVISTEELTLLLRETGSALLDSRLAASDDLTDDTRLQMVRAINKLAVHAAISSSRHTSFQALLNLQMQLRADDTNDEVFRNRLSRVVVKLFARVIKAEESSENSYVQGRIDMEALICALEDTLVANESIQKNPSPIGDDVCEEMIESLLQSIISIHGDSSTLKSLMEELGIDVDVSALGKTLSKCVSDDRVLSTVNSDVGSDAVSNTYHPKTPSKDIASLVARLGNAPAGKERESALESIRAYQREYGGGELDAHLQQLSGPFREFILEQLHRNPSPQKQIHDAGNSVSDRLRNLRSRLQGSETGSPPKLTEAEDLVVETTLVSQSIKTDTVVRRDNSLEGKSTAYINDTTTKSSPIALSLKSATSNIVAPSPSKIPSIKVSSENNSKQSTNPESKIPFPIQSRLLPLASSIPPSSSSAKSLRERLAARQNTTTAMIQQPSISANVTGTTLTSDSSLGNKEGGEYPNTTTTIDSTQSALSGRAAALRARLELVKQQQQQSNMQ